MRLVMPCVVVSAVLVSCCLWFDGTNRCRKLLRQDRTHRLRGRQRRSALAATLPGPRSLVNTFVAPAGLVDRRPRQRHRARSTPREVRSSFLSTSRRRTRTPRLRMHGQPTSLERRGRSKRLRRSRTATAGPIVPRTVIRRRLTSAAMSRSMSPCQRCLDCRDRRHGPGCR
jgi:hypothetical protein